MKDIIQELHHLKALTAKGELSYEAIQNKLSVLVLMNCTSDKQEKVAKKFDNDLELIIYTLSSEKQLDAALNVIDEAILFMSDHLTT